MALAAVFHPLYDGLGGGTASFLGSANYLIFIASQEVKRRAITAVV